MNIHWKDRCWSWSSNTLATWCKEQTHLKRPWCWERLNAGREGDNVSKDLSHQFPWSTECLGLLQNSLRACRKSAAAAAQDSISAEADGESPWQVPNCSCQCNISSSFSTVTPPWEDLWRSSLWTVQKVLWSSTENAAWGAVQSPGACSWVPLPGELHTPLLWWITIPALALKLLHPRKLPSSEHSRIDIIKPPRVLPRWISSPRHWENPAQGEDGSLPRV